MGKADSGWQGFVKNFYRQRGTLTRSRVCNPPYRESGKTGERFADATVRNLHIMLVDPKTKVCFSENTFTGGSRAQITSYAQASSGVNYNSPSVRSFVKKYFK